MVLLYGVTVFTIWSSCMLVILAAARKPHQAPERQRDREGDLDGLYEELKSTGVVCHQPPHDEPWERSTTAFDPDGYAVEFAQGKRGQNERKV